MKDTVTEMTGKDVVANHKDEEAHSSDPYQYANGHGVVKSGAMCEDEVNTRVAPDDSITDHPQLSHSNDKHILTVPLTNGHTTEKGQHENGGVVNLGFESQEDLSNKEPVNATEVRASETDQHNENDRHSNHHQADEEDKERAEDCSDHQHLSTFKGNAKMLNSARDTEITIPEDALINYNTGRVRAKRRNSQKHRNSVPEEKIPMEQVDTVSDKALEAQGTDCHTQNGHHVDRGDVPNSTVPVSSPVTSEKLTQQSNGTGEYFIPVNTHKKFLRGEKLYLTKENRKGCQGWKRFIICGLITIIIAIAVVVGVLAATESGVKSVYSEEGLQLPDQASISQDSSFKTHSSPLLSDLPTTTPLSTPSLEDSTTEYSPTHATTSKVFMTLSPQSSTSVNVPNILVGEFTFPDMEFSESLHDKNSNTYSNMAAKIRKELMKVFRNKGDQFESVQILGFSPGSVTVKFLVIWDKEGKAVSAAEATQLLRSYLHESNKSIAGVYVDSSAIKFTDSILSSTLSTTIPFPGSLNEITTKKYTTFSPFSTTSDSSKTTADELPAVTSSTTQIGKTSHEDSAVTNSSMVSTIPTTTVMKTSIKTETTITDSSTIELLTESKKQETSEINPNDTVKPNTDSTTSFIMTSTLTGGSSSEHSTLEEKAYSLLVPSDFTTLQTTESTEENLLQTGITAKPDFTTIAGETNSVEYNTSPITLGSDLTTNNQKPLLNASEATTAFSNASDSEELPVVTTLDMSKELTTTDIKTSSIDLSSLPNITEENFTRNHPLITTTEASVQVTHPSFVEETTLNKLQTTTVKDDSSMFLTTVLPGINDSSTKYDMQTESIQITTEASFIGSSEKNESSLLTSPATTELYTTLESVSLVSNESVDSTSSYTAQTSTTSPDIPTVHLVTELNKENSTEITDFIDSTSFPLSTNNVSLISITHSSPITDSPSSSNTEDWMERSSTESVSDNATGSFENSTTYTPEVISLLETNLTSTQTRNSIDDITESEVSNKNWNDMNVTRDAGVFTILETNSNQTVTSESDLPNTTKFPNSQISVDKSLTGKSTPEMTSDHTEITTKIYTSDIATFSEPVTSQSTDSSKTETKIAFTTDVSDVITRENFTTESGSENIPKIYANSTETTSIDSTSATNINSHGSSDMNNETTTVTLDLMNNETTNKDLNEMIPTSTSYTSLETTKDSSNYNETLTDSNIATSSDFNYTNNETSTYLDVETSTLNTTSKMLDSKDNAESTTSQNDFGNETLHPDFSTINASNNYTTMEPDLNTTRSMNGTEDIFDSMEKFNGSGNFTITDPSFSFELDMNDTETTTVTESLNGTGCKEKQFMCGMQDEEALCIPKEYVCDGISDCPDKLDEIQSECSYNCSTNFQCNSTSKCVMSRAYCDGIWDCDDGSDEEDCVPTGCSNGQVLCVDGSVCITPQQICDTKYNCHDKSDEVGCVDKSTCEATDRFYCNDGLCIPLPLRCDGHKDCKDNEDEANCSCSEEKFACLSGECINNATRCDGTEDCKDGSDEYGCMKVDTNGVVQVYNSGGWKLLCAENLMPETSEVICQELGFSKSQPVNEIQIEINTNVTSWMMYNQNNSVNLSLGSFIKRLAPAKTCEMNAAFTVSCQKTACQYLSSLLYRRKKRAVEGQPILSSPWPFLAITYNNGTKNGCLSNIISPAWLVTSLECLLSLKGNYNNKTEWFVITKGNSLDDKSEMFWHEVRRFVIHTHSSSFRSNEMLRDYDLALVKLKHPLQFNENKRPICLPPEEVQPGVTCFAGGLANQTPRGKIPQSISIVSMAKVVMDRKTCNQSQHYNGRISNRMLCTRETETQSLCDNDIGAPLVCFSGIVQQWYLAGVLTYQRFCGSYTRQPNIFSYLYPMKDYIEHFAGFKYVNITYNSTLYTIQTETTEISISTTEMLHVETTFSEGTTHTPPTSTYVTNLTEEMPVDESNTTTENPSIDTSTLVPTLFSDTVGKNKSDLTQEEMETSSVLPINSSELSTFNDSIISSYHSDSKSLSTEIENDTNTSMNDSSTDLSDIFTTTTMPFTLTSPESSGDVSSFNPVTLSQIKNFSDLDNINKASTSTSTSSESRTNTVETTTELGVFTTSDAEAIPMTDAPVVTTESAKTFEEPVALVNKQSMTDGTDSHVTVTTEMSQTTEELATLQDTHSTTDDTNISSEAAITTVAQAIEKPATEVDKLFKNDGSKSALISPQRLISISTTPDEISTTETVNETESSTTYLSSLISQNSSEESSLTTQNPISSVSTYSSLPSQNPSSSTASFFRLSPVTTENPVSVLSDLSSVDMQNSSEAAVDGSLMKYKPCQQGDISCLNMNETWNCSNISYKCDSVVDCPDGSDEYGCANYRACGTWNFSSEGSVQASHTALKKYSGEWPSVGVLQRIDNYSILCTASIISPQWILTAASCLEPRNTTIYPDKWQFSVNLTNASSTYSDIHPHQVKQIVMHPDRKTNDNFTLFDVALVQLQDLLIFKQYPAICLPDKDVERNQSCVIVGWDTHSSDNQQYFYHLLVPTTLEECNSEQLYNGTLPPGVLCPGVVDEAPCIEDFGAPLMCINSHSNKWELYGVLISQQNCKKTNRPPVYANVAAISDWLKETVDSSVITAKQL